MKRTGNLPSRACLNSVMRHCGNKMEIVRIPLEKGQRDGVQPSIMDRSETVAMGVSHSNHEASPQVVIRELWLFEEILRIVEKETWSNWTRGPSCCIHVPTRKTYQTGFRLRRRALHHHRSLGGRASCFSSLPTTPREHGNPYSVERRAYLG